MLVVVVVEDGDVVDRLPVALVPGLVPTDAEELCVASVEEAVLVVLEGVEEELGVLEVVVDVLGVDVELP